jgi:hypothetical protein
MLHQPARQMVLVLGLIDVYVKRVSMDLTVNFIIALAYLLTHH